MNRNMLIRLVVDLSMTVLMIVAMAYHITGNTIHELVGVKLLVLFIVHNILNRRWYKTILRGKYHFRRILSIGVNLLFLVSMAVVMISSVPISSDIFPFIPINNDVMLRQIHVLTSYWGFIFMSVHIGMSWNDYQRSEQDDGDYEYEPYTDNSVACHGSVDCCLWRADFL